MQHQLGPVPLMTSHLSPSVHPGGLSRRTGLPAAVREDVSRQVARREHRVRDVVVAVPGLLVTSALLLVSSSGLVVVLLASGSLPLPLEPDMAVGELSSMLALSSALVGVHLLLVAVSVGLAGLLAPARHRPKVRLWTLTGLLVVLGPVAALAHAAQWLRALGWLLG